MAVAGRSRPRCILLIARYLSSYRSADTMPQMVQFALLRLRLPNTMAILLRRRSSPRMAAASRTAVVHSAAGGRMQGRWT